MAESNAVPGFVPSVAGLRFANRFPPGPTLRLGPLDPRWIGIGDASAGLCGGMSWLVRERFVAGLPAPPDDDPPANGSPLFRTLVRRQVLSLDWLRLPLRIWLMAARGPARAARDSVTREWPRIRAEIDAGRPAMIALVRRAGIDPFRLTVNHQVLAYAYTLDGDLTMQIYDPNHPGRDDVELRVRTPYTQSGPAALAQSTGEPLVGFLHARGPGPANGAGPASVAAR